MCPVEQKPVTHMLVAVHVQKEQVVEDAFFAAGKRLTRNAKKQHLHQ